METKTCGKCGATWINGKNYWNTGTVGDEVQLASLVCNNLGDDNCINPEKGNKTGMTWEDRSREVDRVLIDSDKKNLEDIFKHS